MNIPARRVGPIGTVSRVIAGLGLLYLRSRTADCHGP